MFTMLRGRESGRFVNDIAPQPDHFAAAFDAAFIRLQFAIESACMIDRLGKAERPWSLQAAEAIRAAFRWAAGDPTAANVLTNEALACGPDGIACHRRLTAYIAGLLRRGREERSRQDDLPTITEHALAGGLISLVAKHVESGEEAELPALAPEAIQFALTPYLGGEESRLLAAFSNEEAGESSADDVESP
jgi:hypothetical protein